MARDAASPQEIVCTPGHRFYVVGKGCVRAQDLQPGDLALSATGEKIAFVSRENLAEKRRVYNFEVEGKHTYFVGKNIHFLVHNFCFGDKEFVMPWDSRAESSLVKNFQYWGDAVRNFALGSKEMHARNEEKLCERGTNPLSAVNDVMGEDIVTHDNDGSYELAHNFANTMFKSSASVCMAYGKPGQFLESKWNALFVSSIVATPRLMYVHYNVRKRLNNNEQFKLLSEEDLSILAEDKRNAGNRSEKDYQVDIFNDGIIWIRLPKAKSLYHGKGCVKYVTFGGRELVINAEKKLEMSPEYIGTYNFVSPLSSNCCVLSSLINDVGHGVYDVIPYFLWGNSIEDTTPWWNRILGPSDQE